MVLLFDIGGTKVRLAVSNDGRTLSGEPVIFPTPHDWTLAEDRITEAVRAFGAKITDVCGGLPGVFDPKHETILRSPNLTEWVGKPIKKLFENATGGARVRLFNDTVLVGIGEAAEGAGKGYAIVAYLTVSTGVGGARIVNGEPDLTYRASEPGHQIIEATQGLSLENLVSGTAFEKRYGKDFVKLAPASAWEEAALMLAVGVHNTIVHWSPDVVVLGGSMIVKSTGISIDSVRANLREIVKILPKVPPVVLSILGEKAGLIGGLHILRSLGN